MGTLRPSSNLDTCGHSGTDLVLSLHHYGVLLSPSFRMAGRMSIHALLNDPTPSTPTLVDIAPLIRRLYIQLDVHGTLLAPPRLERELHEYIASLGPGATYWARRASAPSFVPPSPPAPLPIPDPPPAPVHPPISSTHHNPLALQQPTQIYHNVKTSSRTTLHKLYLYESPNVFIDYPETHPNGIGYLLRQDLDNWGGAQVIMGNCAYSLNAPKGQTQMGDSITHALFQVNGRPIPCVEAHKTCQGSKICPSSDLERMQEGHCHATPELLAQRLANDRDERLEIASPSAEVFSRTLNYLLALQRVGCRAVDDSEDPSSEDADPTRAFLRDYKTFLQRGYQDQIPRCQGDIRFIEEHDGAHYVQCEHFHNSDNRNHFRHRVDESLHAEYLEAVLEGDLEQAQQIEQAVESLGYGPNVECTTVTNVSSQRLNCPFAHRNEDGILCQPVMKKLDCKVTVRVVEPYPEYRHAFPYALLIVRGIHRHPIPLPQKTPPIIRREIHEILEGMGTNIADMTVRGFLRHPTVL
ncbi:hypothetical protein BDZ89DRAFT_1046255, partial [Hymenopellis radicata]